MSLTRRQAATSLLAGAALLSRTRAWAQPEPPATQPSATQPPPAEPPPADTPDPDEPNAQVDTARGQFDHVLVPVTINGAGPFSFIVDTGANATCINTSLAEKLGLPPGKPSRMHTVAGVRIRPSVMIDRLEVGSRKRRGVRMPSLPIKGIFADGVLGVDWLKGQRLELAFKAQRMEITKSRAEQDAQGRVVVPARRRWGQLTMIDADVGGTRISALVDSGSQLTLCNGPLQKLILEDAKRTRTLDKPVMIDMESIAGERFSGRLLYIPFMRLGGLHLGNVPVVHSDSHVFKLWNLTDVPAILLGLDLLKQFDTVSLDYGRSAVSFDISPDAPKLPRAASSARMRIHSTAALSRKNTAA